MIDTTDMTMEQMQAKFVDLGSQLTIIANDRQILVDEMKKRERSAGVKAKIATMSDDEKAALRIELGPPAFSQPADVVPSGK